MKSKKFLSLAIVCVLLISLSTAAMAAAFTDIDTSPYKNEISYCQSKNYINGDTPTTFSPGGNLTRGQYAVVWCRFMSYRTGHTFTDISVLTPGAYYDIASFILYSIGAVNGTSATTFSPDMTITREQLAVIAMRAEKLTATANPDAYKTYTDSASISAWATEAISACVNNKVFRDLYPDGSAFEPQKAVTRAEVCKLLYNIDNPSHNITISTMTGGTVTPSATEAHAGDVITLTIEPATDKQIKAGTLKYNGVAVSGTTLTMPTTDVTITAEFEDTAPATPPGEGTT